LTLSAASSPCFCWSWASSPAAACARVGPFGPRLLLIGLGFPPLLAILGALTGLALGLSVGGIAILATLAASASYIAAPTAMRMAVPEANAALSITASLGISFPFNVILGIPIYLRLAQWLGGAAP
jgi:uncharacterized protein